MEIVYKTKLPKGREIVISDGRLIISKGMEKIVIPVDQVRAVNCLPWPEDPYLLIETFSGGKIMIEVKPTSKEKIKKVIQEAQSNLLKEQLNNPHEAEKKE